MINKYNFLHLLPILIGFLFIQNAYSNPGDTTWVNANNVKLDWYNNFDTAVIFPDESKTYRKILMYFTLGKYDCPASAQYCHQWDYDIENYIINDGDTIEISRLVTPYATAGWDRFNGNWKQPYVFDVTHFEPLLHDSAIVRVHYSGYSGGFTADVKFAFIEGTPVRNIVGIKELYSGSFKYGDTANPISDNFLTQSLTTPTGTETAAMKVLVTGHGSDANQCCEFQPHSYQVVLDSVEIENQLIWKDDCGMNQLYPQGGTWIYDRANWCPGELIKPNFHIMDGITGDTVDFDVKMKFDNYIGTPGDNGYGSYKVSAVMIYYGPFNKSIDASLENIVAPTTNPDFYRQNPSGNYPIVIVKNTGKNTITSLDFSYGIVGKTQQNYTWTGSIKPLEEKHIRLDSLHDLTLMSYQEESGLYDFQVEITKVNNATDDDATNNAMNSTFIVAPTWPRDMILTLKTSNITENNGSVYIGNPEQTWTITDSEGNVVFSRTGTAADTKYIDTIAIATPGFYKLKLTTNNGMGLHWWPFDQTSQVKPGSFVITNYYGNKIDMKNYLTTGTERDDWGDEYEQYFTINPSQALSVNEWKKEKYVMLVYPNPTKGMVNVTIQNDNGNGTVQLVNMLGENVYSKETHSTTFNLPTQQLDAGVYILSWKNNETTMTQRIVVE